LYKVALRNLARQVRRTLLVSAIYAVAMASLVLNASVAGGIAQMIDDSVQTHLTGQVLIKSAENRAQLGKLHAGKIAPIEDWPAVEEALADVEGVEGIMKRVSFSAMLAHDESRTFVTVYAHQTAGREVVPYRLAAGEFLGGERGGALLSPGVADRLGVAPGDRVTLLATDRSGLPQTLELTVRGLVDTTEFGLFRGTEVHVEWDDAQELFGLDGAPTEYLVAVPDADEAAAALTAALRDGEVAVQPWHVAGEEFLKNRMQLRMSVLGMFGLFAVVIAALVFNIVQLQVRERIREIGTMSALGMTWGQILRLLLTETALLGLITTLGTGALTYLAVLLIGRAGIHWGTAPASIFGSTVLVPTVSPAVVLLFAASLTLMGMIGAVFPSAAAARTPPAETLRAM